LNEDKKRRGSPKNGFELLQSIVPSLSLLPTVKISKAAQLGKAAEYIEQLREENHSIQSELETLRQSVEILEREILGSHMQLPSAGYSINSSVNSSSQMQEMFNRHVEMCTRQNWKYWIFSRIMQPLMGSFDRSVSSTSIDDLARTSGSWLDQQATLVHLRTLVTKSLKELCVDTAILTDPHKIPMEALQFSSDVSNGAKSSR